MPLFVRLFAGVQVPADSRGMHKVLISWSARVCTTGHINKYQLCLRNVYKVSVFVDYVRWQTRGRKRRTTNEKQEGKAGFTDGGWGEVCEQGGQVG